MRFVSSVLIVIGALAASSTAFAQTQFSRNGFYVGVGAAVTGDKDSQVEANIRQGGARRIDYFGSQPSIVDIDGTPETTSDTGASFVAGFDFQNDRVKWAVEAKHTSGHLTGSRTFDPIVVSNPSGLAFSNRVRVLALTDTVVVATQLDNMSALRARVGKQLTERVSISGFIGLAATSASLDLFQTTQVDGTVTLILGAPITPIIPRPVTEIETTSNSTGKQTLLGAQYGIGMDFKLNDAFFIRSEGSWTTFETVNVALQPTQSDTTRLAYRPTVFEASLALVRRF